MHSQTHSPSSNLSPTKLTYEQGGRTFNLRQTNNFTYDFLDYKNPTRCLASISVLHTEKSLSNISEEFTPNLFLVLQEMFRKDTDSNAPLPLKNIVITDRTPREVIQAIPSVFETVTIDQVDGKSTIMSSLPDHVKSLNIGFFFPHELLKHIPNSVNCLTFFYNNYASMLPHIPKQVHTVSLCFDVQVGVDSIKKIPIHVKHLKIINSTIHNHHVEAIPFHIQTITTSTCTQESNEMIFKKFPYKFQGEYNFGRIEAHQNLYQFNRPIPTQITGPDNKQAHQDAPSCYRVIIVYECKKTRSAFSLRYNLNVPSIIELLALNRTVVLAKLFRSSKILFDISDTFTPDIFKILLDMIKQSPREFNQIIPSTIQITDKTRTDVIKKIPAYIYSVVLLTAKNHDTVMSLFPGHIRTLAINQLFSSSLLDQIPNFICKLLIMNDTFKLASDNTVSSFHNLPAHIKFLSIPFTVDTKSETIKSIPAHIKHLELRDVSSSHDEKCNHYIDELIHALPDHINFKNIAFQGCTEAFKTDVFNECQKRQSNNIQQNLVPASIPTRPLALPHSDSDNDIKALSSTNSAIAKLEEIIMGLTHQVKVLSEAQKQDGDILDQLISQAMKKQSEKNEKETEKEPEKLSPLLTNSRFRPRRRARPEKSSQQRDDHPLPDDSSQESEEEEKPKKKRRTEMNQIHPSLKNKQGK